MSETRGKRRVLQGTVTSTGMDKSITVRVERRYKHPKYGKFLSVHKKYMAHDDEGLVAVGDKVQITECRPLSKNKRWRLTEVIHKAAVTDGGVL
ncbi:MAG: 30S ribosomal protein S17 [Planctomycetota bacterium]|nr:30S ribosomal protein S17 [Planctomycetota bacterium]